MKAAVFYGPGDIRIEEREIPQPGEEEVLVQVKVAEIHECGEIEVSVGVLVKPQAQSHDAVDAGTQR